MTPPDDPVDATDPLRTFLSGRRYAVVGASRDRAKFGNRVLRCYLEKGYEAIPVHPRESEIEGVSCVPDLASIEGALDGVSIVTPPAVTEKVVEDAARAGVRRLWMQPGAESEAAVARAQALGLEVIAGGPCVLVALGCR